MGTRTIITVVLSAWMGLTTGAQSVAEQMNEVKDNPAYCYGEGADEDPVKATDIALDDLCQQLSKKNVNVDKARLQKKVKKLERQRGSQTRTLVYVVLADYQGGGASKNPSRSVEKSNYTESQPLSQTNTQVSEPVGQVTQTTPPTSPTTTNNDNYQSQQNNSVNSDSKVNRVMNQMKAVKHLDSLKWLLTEAKEDGLIQNYGAADKVTDSDKVYWWVFTKGEPMQFVAVLSPVKANGKRDNLVTGEEKTLLDYQDCNAVWFTMP